jgi:hypothetical protein
MEYCALVAQLAEHIHGKDKVISSILIEGCVFAVGKTRCKSAALRASDRGLTKMRSILVLGVLQSKTPCLYIDCLQVSGVGVSYGK